MTELEDILSVDKVTEQLKTALSTVYHQALEEKIPAQKISFPSDFPSLLRRPAMLHLILPSV